MIRVAVLTVSDGVAAGKREDVSGQVAVERITRLGWSLVEHAVTPDEADAISSTLARWADSGEVDMVLTLGGTGFGPRDVTPEATSTVLRRPAPGIAERLRTDGLRDTPFAVLSRGVAGICGRTLIVNLAGSEKAVRSGLDVLGEVVPHAVELLCGRTEHA
ncbi:MAG: cytoplasmic protein [Gemmatimonas sp. SG8_38_2]|nr:MAG: cytoplasmic protein [Gemmatimonas sp. SG8_38_2]